MTSIVKVSPVPSPLVSISKNRAIAISTDVSVQFEKRHDNVLRDIKNLIAELPNNRLLNFKETVIERENPSGGEAIKSPAYEITRDGFTLLAMGFTGKKALQFKLAYIDAFDAMEAELLRLSSSATQALTNKAITPAQQRELQEAVSKKALSAPVSAQRTSFKTLWGSIKSHFHVGTYKDLDESQFNSAVDFVESFEWELLDAPKAPTIQAKKYAYPKEMLFQKHFCGKNDDGNMTLPKLDLHTFADRHFDSPLSKLLTELHDDGHNVDAPYAELMAMQFGIKRVGEQLSILSMIGSESGNSALRIICRK